MNTNPVSLKKAIIMYCVVSLFLFFEMAVQVSPSVMSSQLMHDLNISAFGLGLMSGCYFYTYTAMQIPSGFLLDKFNPRLIITASILVCAIGALIFSTAPNLIFAMLARLLMGVGSAFAFVSVLTVTGDLFKAKHFATLTGITQMLAAFGAMSGQLPVSRLVDWLGWRETMVFFGILGLILAACVYFFLRYESHKNLPKTCEFACRKGSYHKVLTSSQTWYLAAYACLLWAPMSGFASLWGVPFLIKVDQFSPDTAAFVCSLMWLGLALASPLLGSVSSSMQNRKLPLAFSALLGLLAFTGILVFKFNPIIAGILIFIAGAACAGQALSFTVVRENNDRSVSSSAIALNNMAVVISGAIFQPLIGLILHRHAADYVAALSTIVAAYLIAVILAVFFIKEPVTQTVN